MARGRNPPIRSAIVSDYALHRRSEASKERPSLKDPLWVLCYLSSRLCSGGWELSNGQAVLPGAVFNVLKSCQFAGKELERTKTFL